MKAVSAKMHEVLEKTRQKIARVGEVLYNAQSTEFIIVTIPTVKATTPFATAVIVILCHLYLYSVIAYGVGKNLDKYHSVATRSAVSVAAWVRFPESTQVSPGLAPIFGIWTPGTFPRELIISKKKYHSS
jgi:hypothetical protein